MMNRPARSKARLKKLGSAMNFEICFLDGKGRLSCQMTAFFSDPAQAARYASEVMHTRGCRALHAAEIYGFEFPMALRGENDERHAA
jgi:hypothetical protein